MKLLPNSNGIYKVRMKDKKTPKETIKDIIVIVLSILTIGFVYQRIDNFITKERLKEKVDYIRINDKRLDFRTEGNGTAYTVVFDGNIGANLNQWNTVITDLVTNYDDLTTFVYNRNGYGFSDSDSIKTPKEQAEELRSVLRKAAIQAPYILVGEEYGSLVLTEFAKEYPDLVAGIVLVNPLVEEEVNTKEFKNGLVLERFRRKMEYIGSNFGFTSLLDLFNLDAKMTDFENGLSEDDIKEFKAHRTKTNYTKAVYNEVSTIANGIDVDQDAGVFAGKPYYLIAKKDQESLADLGDSNLTKVYPIDAQSNFISIENPDFVVNGIRQVVKQANEIKRLQKRLTQR